MIEAGISLAAAGIAFGILASLATVGGLAVTLVDRRRNPKQGEEAQVQKIYVTQELPSSHSAASDEKHAKATLFEDADADVRYVLLLEACLWLAFDLYLAWTTFEEKHRSIELIERFRPELEHDLARFSTELDRSSPGTSRLIAGFFHDTFKQYVRAMRSNTLWLEHRNEGEEEPAETERERKSLREDFTVSQEEIGRRLRRNRAYLSALAEQKKIGPWEILGFASPEDYAEYRRPTMRSLTSSPGELGEDVLQRLLDAPIPLRLLEEEELPPSIRVELMNRLLADRWAEITPQSEIALTEAGKRLLRKRLASWQNPDSTG